MVCISSANLLHIPANHSSLTSFVKVKAVRLDVVSGRAEQKEKWEIVFVHSSNAEETVQGEGYGKEVVGEHEMYPKV